ncbi:hypothetical protein R1flu_016957 [Riccia fluitans]|uniref:C2 domain-containing protein n=1 Tax=Riccia fluitans TaxID=41844 RepID=A0ABD1YNV1_9MARC
MTRAGELIIRLKQVKGVRGDEALGIGKADLYANLSLGGEKRSSQVVNDGGGDTAWNEEFSFKIAAYVNMALYEKLRIYIYDSDYWGDSRRGTAWIDVKSLLDEDSPDEIPDQEYPVVFHGEQRGVIIAGFTFKPANVLPVVKPQLTTVEDSQDDSAIEQLIHNIQDMKPFHRKPKKRILTAEQTVLVAQTEEKQPSEEVEEKKAEHAKVHKQWDSESESSSDDE